MNNSVLEVSALLESAAESYAEGRVAHRAVTSGIAKILHLAHSAPLLDFVEQLSKELAALRRDHVRMGATFSQAHTTAIRAAALLDPLVEAVPQRTRLELQ
jgi:hypothetical protein